MVEVWNELARQREQRQIYSDQVAEIQATCSKDCGKKHVIECWDCYNSMIDKMRQRYLEPSGEEWFSDNAAFLKELDELFSAAKERKVELKAIDTRISEERERWYLDMIRKPQVGNTAEATLGRQEFLDMLEDNTRKAPLLAQDMRDIIRRGNERDIANLDLEEFMKQVQKSQSPAELVEVYVDTFFREKPGSDIPSQSIKYVEMLRSGQPMQEVMSTIEADKQASVGAQQQKERHEKRLEELKRARTAHEQQNKTRKSARDSPDEPQISKELYELPPCAVCAKAIDLQNVFTCTLCQVLSEFKIAPPTAFCSPECRNQGHVRLSLYTPCPFHPSPCPLLLIYLCGLGGFNPLS
jgi:hypothetical protein